MKSNPILIKHSFAYYLPQYHTIPENDNWWGVGFTEWVNVKRAKTFHPKQITHLPHPDLGFYDLSNVSVIGKQYEIARKHSIDTFCFWHYWFADNDMLLEKPAEDLLASNIHVEFCFAWANHSWYNKSIGKLLKEQKYDYSLSKHFNYLLPFFKDPRYRKINNKPVFVIYDHKNCKNILKLKSHFNSELKKNGFDGLFLILENCDDSHPNSKICDLYLNSTNFMNFRGLTRKVHDKFKSALRRFGIRIAGFYKYRDCVNSFNIKVKHYSNQIPIVFPGWDTTIRHGKGGICFLDNTPDIFEHHLDLVKNIVNQKKDINKRFVFIKSWNEWAEGNFIEPSDKNGYTYLQLFNEKFNIIDNVNE